jgi:hypothetical protein
MTEYQLDEEDVQKCIDIVMAIGVKEYRRIEPVYTDEQLAQLWYSGRTGEFIFRLTARYACHSWDLLSQAKCFDDAVKVGDACETFIEDIGNYIQMHPIETFEYFQPGGEYAGFDVGVVHGACPLAMLPFAAARIDDEILFLVGRALNVSDKAMQSFRQCPDNEKHLFAKIAMVDTTGPLADKIADDLCRLVMSTGMTKSVWWNEMAPGLKSILDFQNEQVKQRIHENMERRAYVEMLEVVLYNDEVGALLKKAQAVSSIVKNSSVDEGLIRLRSMFSCIYSPVSDDSIVEALQLLNDNCKAYVIERNHPTWSSGKQHLIS